ncbi:hypothetical protein APHAL10511_003276 [Amanita phalloides]|nr:hypothetical protein APHAL10511_003276 [Amanita phalloides]
MRKTSMTTTHVHVQRDDWEVLTNRIKNASPSSRSKCFMDLPVNDYDGKARYATTVRYAYVDYQLPDGAPWRYNWLGLAQLDHRRENPKRRVTSTRRVRKSEVSLHILQWWYSQHAKGTQKTPIMLKA